MTDETMDNEQHEHGSQPAIAAGRGAIVVGLAVLLGIVLLQIYDRNGGVSKALNGAAQQSSSSSSALTASSSSDLSSSSLPTDNSAASSSTATAGAHSRQHQGLGVERWPSEWFGKDRERHASCRGVRNADSREHDSTKGNCCGMQG